MIYSTLWNFKAIVCFFASPHKPACKPIAIHVLSNFSHGRCKFAIGNSCNIYDSHLVVLSSTATSKR